MREGPKLRQLEAQRGLSLEALAQNPAFIDAALHATRAALVTSQAAKREALRNAVLNSAISGAPAAHLQRIFVELVDQFNEWHLHILKFFEVSGQSKILRTRIPSCEAKAILLNWCVVI